MEKELIMKPEYEQLLLLDLCARLPYGVKAQYYGSEEKMLTVDTIEAIYIQPSVEIVIGQYGLGLNDVKPYLRPMSSMTEEEREELKELTTADIVTGYGFAYKDLRSMCFGMMYIDCQELVDWLNKKMFDYRGLIPKSLAIEVTEENNPYKD